MYAIRSYYVSGVQTNDGRFLFVTKAGAMMISTGDDPLGPYNVLTAPLQGNLIIPEKYRNSNYEDPVLWKDEVQYHMIINAFLDYRAIYLRSGDGIHWTFNPGTAYTSNNTVYANGHQTHCRITSYNVCYTKLLRVDEAADGRLLRLSGAGGRGHEQRGQRDDRPAHVAVL